jgi:uncharacterized phage protein (predicted DNA packaging)
MSTLDKVKKSMFISDDDSDEELTDLIEEAKSDLIPANVAADKIDETDPLILRAIKVYCKMNFGEPDEYDRLKASYDELKAQLGTDSRFTEWSVADGQD